MKRVLIFAVSALMCIGGAGGAVRDGGVASRAKNGTNTNNTQRLTKSVSASRSGVRTSVLSPRNSGANTTNVATRKPTTKTASRSATTHETTQSSSSPRIVARATMGDTDLTQTRTGAEYERCKTSYFTCMDQFCAQKNDDYRRCSCSNRIYDLSDARDVLTQAGEQLSVFTENLDAVGMTAAQASAMKTASDGEAALTADTSASKALLQAILNSIRGQDSSVGGKMSDLNSINISFDTANAFGTMDSGQAIAKYNGQNLYTAVYPQCRAAVRADCNDASLQRAITAYLMAVEQDCNTVQTAIENKRKEMKSAIREGSAMLDLARVENRQKHNSSDIPTCIADVESAILSEQVCGSGYHKCLDNGEYIDIATGAPITGVSDFYKLAQMLTFADGVEAANQKLSKNINNRAFVKNFENRTKMFAAEALDKCVENADVVWAEYLDKALLDIYYAQQAKVDIIKQGCFDFVSACYMNGDQSITAAMQELTGDSALSLQPTKVALTNAMCTDYVNSCNGLFAGDIIQDYINNRQETDTLTACRAVVRQCFDNFGSTNYENFYYPYSGIFTPDTGNAPDWFTLYEYTTEEDNPDNIAGKKIQVIKTNNTNEVTETIDYYAQYKSTCAKQLTKIAACNTPEMIEAAFGGFDKIDAVVQPTNTYIAVVGKNAGNLFAYGTIATSQDDKENDVVNHRYLRPTGVATEVYNQIIDILSTQCRNLQGRFVELQYGNTRNYDTNNKCLIKKSETDPYQISSHGIDGNSFQENMCPRDYGLSVDVKSWGACSCWENGGRRSKNGTSPKCVSVLPVETNTNDARCDADIMKVSVANVSDTTAWCTQTNTNELNQVCPISDSDDCNTSGVPKGNQ